MRGRKMSPHDPSWKSILAFLDNVLYRQLQPKLLESYIWLIKLFKIAISYYFYTQRAFRTGVQDSNNREKNNKLLESRTCLWVDLKAERVWGPAIWPCAENMQFKSHNNLSPPRRVGLRQMSQRPDRLLFMVLFHLTERRKYNQHCVFKKSLGFHSPTSLPWSQLYSTELRLAGGEHSPTSWEHMENSAVHSPALVQRISIWQSSTNSISSTQPSESNFLDDCSVATEAFNWRNKLVRRYWVILLIIFMSKKEAVFTRGYLESCQSMALINFHVPQVKTLWIHLSYSCSSLACTKCGFIWGSPNLVPKRLQFWSTTDHVVKWGWRTLKSSDIC